MHHGIYHAHSTFSHDGHNRVEEIASWAKSGGISFVVLTEHEDHFDEGRFAEFQFECRKNSDAGLCLVPGVEYAFLTGGPEIHVGVIGVESFLPHPPEPFALPGFLDRVRQWGGVSVLHHPLKIWKHVPEKAIPKFDVVEVWNLKNDHPYAPNAENIRKSRKAKHPRIIGSDIHSFPPDRYGSVRIEGMAAGDAITGERVVGALRNGEFGCRYAGWSVTAERITATSPVRRRLLPLASFAHGLAYDALRNTARRLHIKAPGSIVRRLQFRG